MRILYIDVDSLRPDHLGCYGYDRGTSPIIDGLAAEGRRFTNYYASDAPCLPSRTALFGSRFGIHSGVINHGGTAANPRREGTDRGFHFAYQSFARRLSNAGIHTAMYSPFPARHDAWHVLEGFDEYVNPGPSSAPANELYPPMADWLEDNAADDDWFLHVNFWDPHTAYNTPESVGNPFADDPAPEWLTDERIAEYRDLYGPHGARDPQSVGADWSGTFDTPRMPDTIADREDVDQWVDGYDVGVRWMDEHVGKLLGVLQDEGVFEETLIVVSADHGENLGELNIFGDHQTADEYTCNVPLIVSGPGIEPGVDDHFRYNVDLGPTLVDLAGGEPSPNWDGRSFAGALTGEDDEHSARPFIVTGQGAWACQRGVRWDDWLLLRTYHDGHKAILEDVMLFDLAADPHETTNLATDRPDVVEAGLSRLSTWVDDRLQEAAHGDAGGNSNTPDGFGDPMWEVLANAEPLHASGHLEAYAGYLREAGLGEQAETLESRAGEPADSGWREMRS